jgi:hypothetical protein
VVARATRGRDEWFGGPGRLTVLDVAQTGDPGVLGRHDLPGPAHGIAAVDGHAFVAGGDSGLHAVDLADPTRPATVSSLLREGHGARDVAPLGSMLAVAWTDGVQLVDITRPADPVEVAFTRLPYGAGELAVDGETVWTATEAGGVVLLELVQ